MITIYEGPDGTGKTTAAMKQVRAEEHTQYIHNWLKPRNEVDCISEYTKEILLVQSGLDIAMDRSFILSEYIYSKVLQRQSWLTYDDIITYCALLNKQKAKIKLHLFKDITKLKLKDEDKDLPMANINTYYDLAFSTYIQLDNLEIIWLDNLIGANNENN